MADRIVGPLTLVQFLYILVGGIIVYFLFSTVAPVNGTLFILTALPVAVLTLAMAFLKVPDQPKPEDRPVIPKKIEKSQLEQLIQTMDTGGTPVHRVGVAPHKAASVSPSLNQPKNQPPV